MRSPKIPTPPTPATPAQAAQFKPQSSLVNQTSATPFITPITGVGSSALNNRAGRPSLLGTTK